MGLAEDTTYVGALLDAYAEVEPRVHVAAKAPRGAGVPPEMHAGPVNEHGWVEWRMLPTTLTDADVVAVEREFGVTFPPLFRAYLLARLQLFRQVGSDRHDQPVLMTHLPSDRPLGPLRDLLTAWRPLIDARYVPFAEWGDGWGPMCFDAQARGADGDCPVVWLDHERVIPMGEDAVRRREAMEPLARPLYGSFREFLIDVFGRPAGP
ncbi:MAG TPA: SMI1/KNR4 family protein [Tepidisphaeraceae bacterium]|nr:SMI1/KNR4 family protein [Tepidisphaeraceae bacterium]